MKNELLEKSKFKIKKAAFKILKPQLITTAEFYVNDKLKKEIFCESLTANFLQVLYTHWANNDGNFAVSGSPYSSRQATRDTAGSLTYTYSSPLDTDAPIGNTSYGMLFGTGTTPVAPADYNMEALITSGSGAGQLDYQVQTGYQGVEISGSDSSFILERLAVNNSGASIDVTELGLVGTNGSTFLILHDVFTAVTVADTETLRVRLTISITT